VKVSNLFRLTGIILSGGCKKYPSMAKRQAQTRANVENRKCYVIRKSLIGYEILSTLDIDLNKKNPGA